MSSLPQTLRIALPILLGVLLAACDGCTNAGADAGSASGDGGRVDAGRVDGGNRDGGAGADAAGQDASSGCGPSTPHFGEECGQCGTNGCDRYGRFTCLDPGYNACGVCGALDLSNGVKGRACGTCGKVTCADGGHSTECTGEHPKNDCGGCETIPTSKGPPDAGCSTCGTGNWACSTTLNDLSCWGGRATNNSCGGCGRCVVAWADMQDLSAGNFILAGTRVIIEDVGVDPAMSTTPGDTLTLAFDPLVATPAAAALDAALVYISPAEEHTNGGAFALQEFFSANVNGVPGDAHRIYHVWRSLNGMRYVMVFDGFLNQVIARGEIHMGAPPAP